MQIVGRCIAGYLQVSCSQESNSRLREKRLTDGRTNRQTDPRTKNIEIFFPDKVGLRFEETMASSQFEGLLTTLGGYVIIASCLVLLYYVFSALKLHRIKRVFGFCYVVVKVCWFG